MRRVEENRHASSLQLSKEVESQTGVTILTITNTVIKQSKESPTQTSCSISEVQERVHIR